MVEKRRHPRIPATLALRLGRTSSATVSDISRVGVRCTTPRPLPPMTILGLLLELPGSGSDFLEVNCRGVVVRSEVLPGENGPRYESAILFRDLDPEQQTLLENWVERRLTRPDD